MAKDLGLQVMPSASAVAHDNHVAEKIAKTAPMKKKKQWQKWKDGMGPEALKWCTKCTNMVVADETTSLPFLDPVPEDTPQYFDLIKKPMDLSTIQAKLKGSGYRSISGFIDDMLLIAENCRKYNGKDSNLGVAADALRPCFAKQ